MPRVVWRPTRVQQATWNRKQESSNEQQRFDIFDVVYHFSEAADLIQDPEQRLVIARLNLIATIKGKNSMGAASHYYFVFL